MICSYLYVFFQTWTITTFLKELTFQAICNLSVFYISTKNKSCLPGVSVAMWLPLSSALLSAAQMPAADLLSSVFLTQQRREEVGHPAEYL